MVYGGGSSGGVGGGSSGGVGGGGEKRLGVGSIHIVAQKVNVYLFGYDCLRDHQWLRIVAQSVQAQLVAPRVAGSYKRLLVVYVRKADVAMQYAASRTKKMSSKALLSTASTQAVFRIPTAHIEMDTDQGEGGEGVVLYDFDSRFPGGPISVATSRSVYKHMMNIVRNFGGGGEDDGVGDGGGEGGSGGVGSSRRRTHGGSGSDDSLFSDLDEERDDPAAFFASSDEFEGLGSQSMSGDDGEGGLEPGRGARGGGPVGFRVRERFHFQPRISAMGNVTAHMATAPNISFILSLIGMGGVDTIPSAIFNAVGIPLSSALDAFVGISESRRGVVRAEESGSVVVKHRRRLGWRKKRRRGGGGRRKHRRHTTQ